MKLVYLVVSLCLAAVSLMAQPNYDFSKLQREHLGRGVVAIREYPSTVVVSWRYLSSGPTHESYDVNRVG